MASYDRRGEPRIPFVCDVSYVVDGVRFARRATDLSVAGIYIEDNSPPVIGSEVEVQFEIDGCPLTAKGIVVSSQPPIGFGVKLTMMSDDDRELVAFHVMSAADVVGV